MGMFKVGNITGAKGTLAVDGVNVSYEILHVDGGMDNSQDAHVRLEVGTEAVTVKYSSDSRTMEVPLLALTTGPCTVRVDVNAWRSSGMTLKGIPAWVQSTQEGPDGVADAAWMAIAAACQAADPDPLEDPSNYSIEDGDVLRWVED